MGIGRGSPYTIIVTNNGNPAFEMFGHFLKRFGLDCACMSENTMGMIDIWGWLMWVQQNAHVIRENKHLNAPPCACFIFLKQDLSIIHIPLL